MYTNKRVIEEKTEMAIYKKLSSSDFRIPELETDNNVLKKLFPRYDLEKTWILTGFI